MASKFKKLSPLFNRILVQKFEAQTKTSSGIILTEQGNSNSIAKVVEVGSGNYNNDGKVIPLAVKVGDYVLLPDYGGSKVKLNNEEYYLYRDTDLLGILKE